MSIEEESFPYDSLFDTSVTPSPTKFQLKSSETFKVFGCSSTFIADKNSTLQSLESNNNNTNTNNNNINTNNSLFLKRFQSFNNGSQIKAVPSEEQEAEKQRARLSQESLDRLEARCHYLCQQLDEKYLDIVRLKNNINFLSIELLSSENRVRELQAQVPKSFASAASYLQIARKNEVATQTEGNQTPTRIKSAFLFVTESSQIDDLNTTKIKKYNIKLQHRLSTDNYEETVLEHTSHYACDRNKGSVPLRTKTIPANSTRSTSSTEDRAEEPKSSSEQLSSSMRCSSDSAIELETAEKQQKDRLKLFQRRQRFKVKIVGNQQKSHQHEIAHGIYGDYRALEESDSDLVPVDMESQIKNNNSDSYCTYEPLNSPHVGSKPMLFGLCNPCLYCMNRNGNDGSYLEMNLLGNQSAVFNVPKAH